MAFFKISGDKKILKKLNRLDKQVGRKVTVKALRAGAKKVRIKVLGIVPVKSGTLKHAIKVRAAKSKRKNSFGVMVQIGSKDFQGKSYYGAFLNFGTKTKDGKEKIKKREFMEKGFEASKDEARREFFRVAQEEIRKLMAT